MKRFATALLFAAYVYAEEGEEAVDEAKEKAGDTCNTDRLAKTEAKEQWEHRCHSCACV